MTIHLLQPSRERIPSVGSRVNRSLPLARGLVGYWPMLEGAGDTVHDYSGWGNHGTMAQADQAGKWSVWHRGKSVAFDGVDDSISTGTKALYNQPHGSMSAWFSATSPDANARMVHLWESNDARVSIIITGDGYLQGYGRNNTFNIVDSEDIRNTGWRHVALTWDASAAVLYLDGIAVATEADNNTQDNWGGDVNLYIGRYGSGTGWEYAGDIANVTLHDRALYANEIRTLYTDPWHLFRRPRLYVRGGAAPTTTTAAPTFAGRSKILCAGMV